MRAREKLIEALVPRIAAVARDYRMTPVVERGEMLQAGVLGVLEALEHYDPERGTPFWSFARGYVRRAMRRSAAELLNAFVLSNHAVRDLSRIRSAQEELWRELERDPTPDELARRTGLPRDRVKEILTAVRPPRSKDELISTPDGDVLGKLEDRLADPSAEEELDNLLDRLESEQLRSLLSALTDRERKVLRALYVDERTVDEVAEELGLGREQVRQSAERARRKLGAAARALGVEA